MNTKQKGRKLVKIILAQVRNELDRSAYEVSGSGAGLDKGDIRIPILDLVIEAKNCKVIQMANWVKQAEREGLGHSNTALMWRHPKSSQENPEVRVDISLDYFITLASRYKEPKIKVPDRDLKWALTTLKNAINQVLKKL